MKDAAANLNTSKISSNIIESSTGEHAQVHLCQECKTEFKYKSALTRHIRVIHANPESRRQNVKARPKHKRRRSETQSKEDICDPDEDNISFLRDSVERQREWNRLLGFGSHFILPDNCIFATGTGDGYGNEDDYHSLSSIAHPSSFPSSPYCCFRKSMQQQ